MKVAIYNKSSGAVKAIYEIQPSVIHLLCNDNEEFYLNPPIRVTHIINGEPEDRSSNAN